MKKTTHRLLTVALKDGVSVHINDVENGKKCNCVCPYCRLELEAVNAEGNIPIAHFRHVTNKKCLGAYESALHLLAKEVLTQTKRLQLPDYLTGIQNIREIVGGLIEFDSVKHEVNYDSIRPDVVCRKGEFEIFVEFAKTHFVDDDKKEKIKKLGYSCIEIDIRKLPLDKENIRSFILKKSPDIKYLYNHEYAEEEEKERAILEKEQSERNAEKLIFQQKYLGVFEMTIQNIEKKPTFYGSIVYVLSIDAGFDLPTVDEKIPLILGCWSLGHILLLLVITNWMICLIKKEISNRNKHLKLIGEKICVRTKRDNDGYGIHNIGLLSKMDEMKNNYQPIDNYNNFGF